MDRIKYNINQSIFKAGDPPDKMYLLVKVQFIILMQEPLKIYFLSCLLF